MQTDTPKRSSLPYPKLPSLHGDRTRKTENVKTSVERQKKKANITKDDMAAASTLMNLRKESTVVLRRLMKAHKNNTGSAVKAILDHAMLHSKAEVEPTKAVRCSDQDKRVANEADKEARRDAALTLLELSGGSREEGEAALTLMDLRRESDCAILAAQRSQFFLARMAEQREAKLKSLALKKFREQYPAVLRTSMWRSESGLREDDVVIQR